MEPRDCRFCPIRIRPFIVAENETVWALPDRYPVSDGHHLIVPKRHTESWFTMSDQERRDAEALIMSIRSRLIASDAAISGFNIGMNCGRSAGQTIYHAHIHLIPRRDGDTPDPTGGVRGVIPGRMTYPTG